MGKTEYTIKSDIKQGQLEEWARAFTAFPKWENHSVLYHGAIVRAAISTGWIEGLDDPKVVSEWTGAEVRALAKAIDERYTELTTIDPNS